MIFDDAEHWAEELDKHKAVAARASDFILRDEIFPLTQSLLTGSTICRRLIEETEELEGANAANESHFAVPFLTGSRAFKNKQVHMKDCWEYKQNESLELSLDLSLSRYDLFSQLIHARSLQLHKSPDIADPSFWFASERALEIKGSNSGRFYHLTWQKYSEILADAAACLTLGLELN